MDELEDISRRVLAIIPTILGAVTLSFLIIHLAPGDPVRTLMGDYDAPPEVVEKLRHQFGLDKPLYAQYGTYLFNVLSGDFGKSFRTGREVMGEILRVFPHTLFLALGAVILAILIGIPLGILSAVRSNTAVDHLSRVIALLGISMPSFWLALVLLLVFSVYAGWFPLVGAGELDSPASILRHLFLPALALAARDAAAISRLTRSGILEIMRQDYILTARAKGLAERIVIYKHALRNALIPIVTVISLDLGYTLGGTVVIEAVFSRPGLGSLIIQSIYSRDYPQLQGAIMFFALCFLLVNLLTDLVYKFVDPRIEYKGIA
jgi:peptide/nickel transport system permease protein/oligopeptide transport system permease protein